MFNIVTVQGDIIAESVFVDEIIKELGLAKIEEIEENLSIDEKIEHNHYIYLGALSEQIEKCTYHSIDTDSLKEFKKIYNDERFIDREQMIFIMET